ncbi:hypothetical protein [Paenibacillus graminis]|uniref:hypothetical protein n=1 Tax=Paenibacillus graminis TaxID=189425 RepID=UPI0030EBDCF5
MHDLIDSLLSTIKELSITNSEKTELQEAVHLLQEELKSEQPKSLMVRALIAFLEKEHGLKDILRQLEKLVVNHL